MTYAWFIVTFLLEISIKELHAATLAMPLDALKLTSEENTNPLRCSKPSTSKLSSTAGSPMATMSGWPYSLPYHSFGMPVLPSGFLMPNSAGNLSIPGIAPGIPAPSTSMTHLIHEFLCFF